MRITTPMLVVAIAAGSLAGCGESEKTPTQAIARVGETELTIHQLNAELVRQGPQASENKELSRKMLDIMINQQMLADKAVAEELDRDPNVVQALERSRRMILAEAYLTRKLPPPAAPADAEVKSYYEKHPELFADRKTYTLRQVVMPASAMTPDLRQKLDGWTSLDPLVNALSAANVQAKDQTYARASEDLPLQLVSRIHKLPEGQIFVFNAANEALVFQLVDVAEHPVTEAKAAPVIQRFLQNKARSAAIDAEINRLRAETKIEYLGDFAASGTAAAKSTAQPQPQPAAAQATPLAGDADVQDVIKKGAGGLN